MNSANHAEPIERFLSGRIPTLTEEQAEALYFVGYQHYEQDQYDAAADVFRLLALVRPNRARSWLSLGAVHEAVNDFERAAALYSIAATSHEAFRDERALAFLYRARVHAVIGEKRDALDDVDTFFDLASHDVEPEVVASAEQLRGRLRRAR
jgi:tetratricopeptide (TPR) repeat protein